MPSHRSPFLRAFTLFVPVLLSACGAAPADDSTEGPASDDTPAQPARPSPPAAPGSAATGPVTALSLIDTAPLEACAGKLGDDALAEQLQIAVALHDSIHELVACGGMTVTIAATLVSGVASAIIAGTTSFEPDGIVYDGEGRYVTSTGQGGEGTLTVRFWQEGPDGPEPIRENLFDLSTYLAGARISSEFDGRDVRVEVAFDAPGPRVEMLGFGKNPSSPLRLDGDDLLAMAPVIDGISVSSDVLVDDRAGDSVVSYGVRSTPMPLEDLLPVGNIDYELLSITATNSRTHQQATDDALDWDIAFGQAALTGSASFRIEGGAFDYELYYGHSADHSDDIVISCAE